MLKNKETNNNKKKSLKPDFDWRRWNSQSFGPSWLLKVLALSFAFFSLPCALAILTLQPLRRLTDNQGRQEEEGKAGMGYGGDLWMRRSCDIPSQGYLILSIRGERLSCCVWL